MERGGAAATEEAIGKRGVEGQDEDEAEHEEGAGAFLCMERRDMPANIPLVTRWTQCRPFCYQQAGRGIAKRPSVRPEPAGLISRHRLRGMRSLRLRTS